MTQEESQTRYNHFFELVRKMRGWQKEYAKWHARSDLDKVKYYQRKVDEFIKEEVEKQKSKSQELF